MTRRTDGGTSVVEMIKALARPLRTDRAVPPIPGTLPETFERLYARRPDPIISPPHACVVPKADSNIRGRSPRRSTQWLH